MLNTGSARQVCHKELHLSLRHPLFLSGDFLKVSESKASETFGIGTLTALAVSLPLSEGIALAAAAPAPVEVITIFMGAERPRLGFL